MVLLGLAQMIGEESRAQQRPLVIGEGNKYKSVMPFSPCQRLVKTGQQHRSVPGIRRRKPIVRAHNNYFIGLSSQTADDIGAGRRFDFLLSHGALRTASLFE